MDPMEYSLLGGAFKYFCYFQPYLGKIPILTNIFSDGWFNHQLVLLSQISLFWYIKTSHHPRKVVDETSAALRKKDLHDASSGKGKGLLSHRDSPSKNFEKILGKGNCYWVGGRSHL